MGSNIEDDKCLDIVEIKERGRDNLKISVKTIVEYLLKGNIVPKESENSKTLTNLTIDELNNYLIHNIVETSFDSFVVEHMTEEVDEHTFELKEKKLVLIKIPDTIKTLIENNIIILGEVSIDNSVFFNFKEEYFELYTIEEEMFYLFKLNYIGTEHYKILIEDFIDNEVNVGYKFAKNFYNGGSENEDKTLVDLLKRIDNSWVEATEDEDGIFSKEDKRLLLYLKEQAKLTHLSFTNLSNLDSYSNLKHIVIENDSYLSIEDYKKVIPSGDGNIENTIEQGVKLKVNDNIMKLLKFKSSSSTNINYDEVNHELLITQKNFEFISDKYLTVFEINHNLGTTNITTNIFSKNDENNIWVNEIAKVEILDENNIKVNFTEALKCKVIISAI